MSVILYILLCLFILQMLDILSVKTPKDDGVYTPTPTTSILIDTDLTTKNGSNKYSNITLLLDKIKDKDTKLMSNVSETLRQNAIGIADVYLKYNTDDDVYKERVISQLTIIDTYLERLMDESLLPGTKRHIENTLDINQRYLESIIDNDIIKNNMQLK